MGKIFVGEGHVNTNSKQEKRAFQCSKLSDADIRAFRSKLFASNKKTEQDTFLLLNAKVSRVAKRRALDSRRCRDQANTFTIKLVTGENVRVCRSTFQAAIKPIGYTRVTGVLKWNFDTGTSPKEKRGGDRIKKNKCWKEGLCPEIHSVAKRT